MQATAQSGALGASEQIFQAPDVERTFGKGVITATHHTGREHLFGDDSAAARCAPSGDQ